MRSFEGFQEHNQRPSPELTGQRIEDVYQSIENSPEVGRYLEQKINDKINFKARVTHDDGTNDFSEWKRLGMFIVHEQRLPDELVSILKEHDIDVYGDEVMELHIPPQDSSPEEVRKSFDRLREYLTINKHDRRLPRYIYGVSYLAKYARRWGFTVVDLPESIRENSGAARVLESYATADDPKNKKLFERFKNDDIKMCYMSIDEFLM